MTSHRAGFVSLIGRPNAGKSTLLNALVGDKLAIVSSKPQTTRTMIQGVLTTPEAQVVFLDTPGIHKSDTLLNRRMMHTVRESLDGRDLILFLADASATPHEEDRQAIDVLQRVDSPVFLVLNKIDRVSDKRLLLPLIEQYRAIREFTDYIPVSALRGYGLDDLKKAIFNALPEGAEFFPADYLTDQPERFLAAELIREKVLTLTRQEVPHAVAVLIEEWEEKKKLLRISASVIVERPGQKAILIGAQGAMLRKIGSEARLEMERIFARRIFLSLHVRVQPDWRENPQFVGTLDWRAHLDE